MQHTSRITNTTPVHSHIDYLVFYVGIFALIGVFLQKCLPCTKSITTIKSLFSLICLSIFYDVFRMTCWTSNRFKNHSCYPFIDKNMNRILIIMRVIST